MLHSIVNIVYVLYLIKMDLRKICFLLLVIVCTTRQFVDRDIIGNRDLDSETY